MSPGIARCPWGWGERPPWLRTSDLEAPIGPGPLNEPAWDPGLKGGFFPPSL